MKTQTTVKSTKEYEITFDPEPTIGELILALQSLPDHSLRIAFVSGKSSYGNTIRPNYFSFQTKLAENL